MSSVRVEQLESIHSILAALDAEYPVACRTLDGLEVGYEIANINSIDASFDRSHVLEGVREVSTRDFGGIESIFYAADDLRRANEPTRAIEASGRIDPLIIAMDSEGPYVLEGAHRFAALLLLGKTKIPALVVADIGELEEAIQDAL